MLKRIKRDKNKEPLCLENDASSILENIKFLIALSNKYIENKELSKDYIANIKHIEKKIKKIKSVSYFLIGHKLSMFAIAISFFTMVSAIPLASNWEDNLFGKKSDKALRENIVKELVFKDYNFDKLSNYEKISLSANYLNSSLSFNGLSEKEKSAVRYYHNSLLSPISNKVFLAFSFINFFLWFNMFSTRQKEIKENLKEIKKFNVKVKILEQEVESENLVFLYKSIFKKYLNGSDSVELKNIYKQLYKTNFISLNKMNDQVIEMKYGRVVLNMDVSKNDKIPYSGEEHLSEVLENEMNFKKDMESK